MGELGSAFRAEEAVLHGVVDGYLEEFLAHRGGQLPKFIVGAFEQYRECGRIEVGHAHVLCEYCGHMEVRPFTCKRRGLCPSCGRRAAREGAKEMVERVLPQVPYRQLVVSYGLEINHKLAFQPPLCSAAEQLVIRALQRWQVVRCGGGDVMTGGVLVRHRFGGSLNLLIHSHMVLIAGVYRREGERLTFVPDPGEPTQAELDKLVQRLRVRTSALLKRRGVATTSDGQGGSEDDAERPLGGKSARAGTMHLYVSGTIAASQRDQLQRLCEYLLRGPIEPERLRQRGDGKLSYRLRKPDRHGKTEVVLTPLEFLERMSSLIPGPYQPARRYFGILASGCKERGKVTPGGASSPKKKKPCRHCAPEQTAAQAPDQGQGQPNPRRDEPRSGSMRCPECGHTMVYQAVHRRENGGCALLQRVPPRARDPP